MSHPAWDLENSNLSQQEGRQVEVAILPWGATEAHNLHLPYGIDTLMARVLALRASEKASAQGAHIAVLPPVPYGTQNNTMGYPLTINMSPSTQFEVLKDIVDSVKHHGIPKMLLLNGHGGNDFFAMQRELYGKGVFLAVCNWYGLVPSLGADLFEDPQLKKGGDHAGEFETSVALSLFPDLVGPIDKADEGQVRSSKVKAFDEGWVKIARPWHLLTRRSGVGNPKNATKEKGDKLVERVVDKLTEFLVEFSRTPADKDFPY